jgi:ankyrin repeat protein
LALDDDWFEQERLHRAAAEGDIDEMQRLVAAGYDLHKFDDLQYTPLHYAVAEDRYKAAQWLIEAGSGIDANDEEMIGETPLCIAAQRDYPEMVELLLRHGADPDITGWMGNTARSRADRRKDEEGRQIAALIRRYRPVV